MSRPASYNSIIAGAELVFSQKALADITVEDLLTAGRISRRTFYKSFSNKQAVLAALYRTRTQALIGALKQGYRSGDPMTALLGGIDAYVDYHVVAGPLLRIMIEEAGRSGSLMAEQRECFRGGLLVFIRDATGVDLDPWLFNSILAGLEGISLQLFASGLTDDDLAGAKRAARALVERVLRPELG